MGPPLAHRTARGGQHARAQTVDAGTGGRRGGAARRMRNAGRIIRSYHLEAPGTVSRPGGAGERQRILRFLHRAALAMRGGAVHGREASGDVVGGDGTRSGGGGHPRRARMDRGGPRLRASEVTLRRVVPFAGLHDRPFLFGGEMDSAISAVRALLVGGVTEAVLAAQILFDGFENLVDGPLVRNLEEAAAGFSRNLFQNLLPVGTIHGRISVASAHASPAPHARPA